MAADAQITDPLVWIATGGLIAWITAFITLRKDDKAVVIENITKERKEWRDFLRHWIDEISDLSSKNDWSLILYSKYRAQLISRLNLNDQFDKKIINYYDRNFNKSSRVDLSSIRELQKKISMLLKFDWERVKIVCTPIYLKVFNPKFRSRKMNLELLLKTTNTNSSQKLYENLYLIFCYLFKFLIFTLFCVLLLKLLFGYLSV